MSAAVSGAEITRSPRVSLRATLGAAIVATLVRPTSWAFGLAGFLAGGGLLLVAWPMLVLPTPTGIQNALGGPATLLVFGTVTGTMALLFLAGFAAAALLVVGGCWIGAWAEREGIAEALDAAEDEGLLRTPAPDLAGAPGVGSVAAVRLMSLLPVMLVLGLAWLPVYDAAYRQLTVPDELVTPLPVRVLRDVPGLVAAILLTWLVSDAAAAVAVRRLMLDRRSVLAAWALGWVDLVRSPLRVLGTALAGVGVLVCMIAPALLAVAVGWGRVREAFLDGRAPLAAIGLVVVGVSLWMTGLVMAGVASAFRNAAWTFLSIADRHRRAQRTV